MKKQKQFAVAMVAMLLLSVLILTVPVVMSGLGDEPKLTDDLEEMPVEPMTIISAIFDDIAGTATVDNGRIIFDIAPGGGVYEMQDKVSGQVDAYDTGLSIGNSTFLYQANVVTPTEVVTTQYFEVNGLDLIRTYTIRQDYTYVSVEDVISNPTSVAQSMSLSYWIDTGMNSNNEWFLPDYSPNYERIPDGTIVTPISSPGMTARNRNYLGADMGDSHNFVKWQTQPSTLTFTSADNVVFDYPISLPAGGSTTILFDKLGTTISDIDAEREAGITPSGLVNVALVPGPRGDHGGTLPTTAPSFSNFAFTNVPIANVNAATLANYDIVVLVTICDPMTEFTASQRSDIIDWISNGGKLIIYDSECHTGVGSPPHPFVDYSWLPYPFTTSVPGALGATKYSCSWVDIWSVEDNTLSSSDPASLYYINTTKIAYDTDAVGDQNVMITRDRRWCGDMKGVNAIDSTGAKQAPGTEGFSHAYARYGNGLFIYNGLDIDDLSSGNDPDADTARGHLAKIWLLELETNWTEADLPCGELVVDECVPCVSIEVDVSINNNNGAIPYMPWNVFRYNVSVKNNQTYTPGKSRIAITYGLIDPTPKTITIGTFMPDIYLDDTYNFSGDFNVPEDVYSGNYVFFAAAFDMETGCCGCNAVPFSVEMPSWWIASTSKEESWENWLEIVED